MTNEADHAVVDQDGCRTSGWCCLLHRSSQKRNCSALRWRPILRDATAGACALLVMANFGLGLLVQRRPSLLLNNGQSTLGFGNNFTWDNSCFQVTENPFAESEPSKMDATITNWCIHRGGEDITLTLGCSKQPQAGPSCPNNNTKIVFQDPKCPVQGSPQNHCAPGIFPVCYQTWTEQCSDGPAYCTADQGVIWCVECQQ